VKGYTKLFPMSIYLGRIVFCSHVDDWSILQNGGYTAIGGDPCIWIQ
jgi:hypothetical protein